MDASDQPAVTEPLQDCGALVFVVYTRSSRLHEPVRIGNAPLLPAVQTTRNLGVYLDIDMTVKTRDCNCQGVFRGTASNSKCAASLLRYALLTLICAFVIVNK